MTIREIVWLRRFEEKIETKHGVTTTEVQYVLEHRPFIRFQERGRIKGENLYTAWGRTAAGRYVVVFFIRKRGVADQCSRDDGKGEEVLWPQKERQRLILSQRNSRRRRLPANSGTRTI